MSKKQTVIFKVNQLQRSEGFRIATVIESIDGIKVVKKLGYNIQASRHLHGMLKNYELIGKQYSGINNLSILKPRKLANGVEYDYIEGNTVERMLFLKIMEDDQKGSMEIIDRFINIVDHLKTTLTVPTNNLAYKKIFGSGYASKTECASLGLIDLNLDNFIETPDKIWHLFDYEWVFKFPVPKHYIISRFFYNFFITRYQSLFKKHASRLDLIDMGGEIIIPKFIYTNYKKYLLSINKTVTMESKFQNYVTGRTGTIPRVYTKKPIHFSGEVNSLQYLLDNPQLVEGYERTIKENGELRDESIQLKNELASIKGSKGYRAIESARRIKNIRK